MIKTLLGASVMTCSQRSRQSLPPDEHHDRTYITDEEQNESDIVLVAFKIEISFETVEFCSKVELSAKCWLETKERSTYSLDQY